MDWKAIKREALAAGEQARMVRYAMDEADNPEPHGAVHLRLSGASATEGLAAGEAKKAAAGTVLLKASWEKAGAISYARAWSEGVASVLRGHGLPCELVEVVDRAHIDDGSLRRGLRQLPYLGCVWVSGESGHPGLLQISQHPSAPVVLELSAEQAQVAGAYLTHAESIGLTVRRESDGARVCLGSTEDEVVARVMEAMTLMYGVAPLVLQAGLGQESFPAW